MLFANDTSNGSKAGLSIVGLVYLDLTTWMTALSGRG